MDGEAAQIPEEEQRLLERVRAALAARAGGGAGGGGSQAAWRSDQELIALRDEIAEARREDVPALVAQMERLQGISLRRAEAQGVLVDPASPYFGHLRLRESVPGRGSVERDVFIGRASFVDPERRVSIVDWRDAPVSQLYYRYDEGSDYEERFGEREVEGEIRARRTLTIEGGELLRVACPQGVWARAPGGGNGVWGRSDNVPAELAGGEGTATRPQRGGVLGAPAGGSRAQRLDRHLPEIAALIDPRQFEIITARRAGVVVIQGGAGSGKTTIGLHRMAYLAHAARERFPPRRMLVVTYGPALAAYIGQVLPALGIDGVAVLTFEEWVTRELRRAIPWLDVQVRDEAPPVVARVKAHPGLLGALEGRARAARRRARPSSRAAVDLWAELVTDRQALLAAVAGDARAPLPEADVVAAHRFMADQVAAVMDRDPGERRRRDTREAPPDDEEVRGEVGIDGLRTEGEAPLLDLADAALLVHASQLLRGPKRRVAHLFVDEAQDLSPVEIAALVGQTAPAWSVTLAGDTAQRLFLDNGFHDWRAVLDQLSPGLGLAPAALAVEPLAIAYRSTRQILELARQVMGPLAAGSQPAQAPRSGAPVEAHRFPGTGAAVAFLAEALPPLRAREPRASVAILARHREQADRYFDGLRRAEIPLLRRVRAQHFAFGPGVEVTEVREVKGLEFDYVILVDVNAGSYGEDAESRHLLHIGATRAAHQLWLIATAAPSPLIPTSCWSGAAPA
jgi:DNA helicase-2/ATP-dependent DNA helicase PcrA